MVILRITVDNRLSNYLRELVDCGFVKKANGDYMLSGLLIKSVIVPI